MTQERMEFSEDAFYIIAEGGSLRGTLTVNDRMVSFTPDEERRGAALHAKEVVIPLEQVHSVDLQVVDPLERLKRWGDRTGANSLPYFGILIYWFGLPLWLPLVVWESIQSVRRFFRGEPSGRLLLATSHEGAEKTEAFAIRDVLDVTLDIRDLVVGTHLSPGTQLQASHGGTSEDYYSIYLAGQTLMGNVTGAGIPPICDISDIEEICAEPERIIGQGKFERVSLTLGTTSRKPSFYVDEDFLRVLFDTIVEVKLGPTERVVDTLAVKEWRVSSDRKGWLYLTTERVIHPGKKGFAYAVEGTTITARKGSKMWSAQVQIKTGESEIYLDASSDPTAFVEAFSRLAGHS